ncbi:MAG: hypothetical protein HDT19_05480 [Oscillibacter sp.]|nr:hypothetical protein [Oscillibacter sp.]
MVIILTLGIFWTLYGMAGILGFQIIGEKYKNHHWTSSYIRCRGISWLTLGIPMLVLYLLDYSREINRPVMCLLILLCGIPSIVYSIVKERKYERMLKEE